MNFDTNNIKVGLVMSWLFQIEYSVSNSVSILCLHWRNFGISVDGQVQQKTAILMYWSSLETV
jgi:hypothetical protein